jgi:hypothetical protein
MQSLRQSFSFLPGLPAQLVQNLNAGTLRTHSCEKNRAQANAFHVDIMVASGGINLYFDL